MGVLLALGVVLTNTAPVMAQSPSPSPSSTTTQKLKERIEKVVEEKRDQVKGVIDEISGKKRAFIGEVQRVSEESLSLKTTKGNIIVPLTNQVILTKGNARISFSDIAVGDWIIAIGNRDREDFLPERIIVSGTSLRPTPKVITLGSIKSINRGLTEMTITPRSGDAEQTFQLVKSTSYQDLEAANISNKSLAVDLQVLVIGKQKGDNVEAMVIRVLTSAASLPSIKPSPTPRAVSPVRTTPRPTASPGT